MPIAAIQHTPIIQPTTRAAGMNLLFLFGLPGSGQVLVIGKSLAYWRTVFPDCRFEENFPPTDESVNSYDLILYHSGAAATWAMLQGHLKKLAIWTGSNAEKTSCLLVFGENFYSLANFKGAGGRQCIGRLDRRQFHPRNFRKVFDAAGLSIAKEFVGLPSFERAEELVVPGSRFLEIHRHSWLLWNLARLGCFHSIADGLVFVVAAGKVEEAPLVGTVAHLIEQYWGGVTCSCRLERLDIRLRGGLMAFVTDQNSQKSFIARLVADPATRSVVRRNQDFLNFLRNAPELAEARKASLPEPVGNREFAENSLFVETLMEGVLAWKVNTGRLREPIYREAIQLIFELQLAMRRQVVLSEEQVRRLFRQDIDRVQACPGAERALVDIFLLAMKKVQQLLVGKECFLTVSHGDYGYGNILVDPCSGKLTGVIDWDTGRHEDLPGIDYLNLVVQKKRNELGCGMAVAFGDVCREVLGRGAVDENGFYASEFKLTGDLLRVTLYVCLLRYMSRAAQYPEVFVAEQRDYLACFQVLRGNAPI